MLYDERKVTSFDNLSLYVRDYGDPLDSRHPLLCLGGLTRNCKDFEDLAERYSSSGRRVICLDYRGRGQSDYDKNWRNYEPKTYIRDIGDVLTALDLHSVVIVGTSLGGIIGMGMAAANPCALSGLVMNDIGPEVQNNGLKKIINYIKHDRPQANLDDAIATIKKMLPSLSFQDETIWTKMVLNTFRKCDDGKLRFDWDLQIVKPLLQPKYKIPNLWPLFRGLKQIPTLVIRGAQSDILSQDCFYKMKTEKPDIYTVEVPETGHTPALSEPESCAALDKFLGRY